MQRRVIAVLLALAGTACAKHLPEPIVAGTNEPAMGYVRVVAAIPRFDADWATRDANATPVYALVGVVVDSDSGQPLGSSQILIRRAGDGQIMRTLTDPRGGFVLPRIPPGQYGLIVRRLGYISIIDLRTAMPGVVDTLRLKMAESHTPPQLLKARSSAE